MPINFTLTVPSTSPAIGTGATNTFSHPISDLNPLPDPSMKFEAVWKENNQHLAETLLEKITHKVFFILNGLLRFLVIPASCATRESLDQIKAEFDTRWSSVSQENQFLKKNFTPSPIEVTTPDGAKLRGTFFKNVAAQESAPTVIFFQPNAMVSKQECFDWLMKNAAILDFRFNFVYFDHRGCGESQGAPESKKSFYLDGESIYQFVRDKLHVPPKDIHFYGWSLGGGVSANVKAINPECIGNYVNERSFTSINNVIKNVVSPLLAAIGGFFMSTLNWNIEGAKAIQNLKGKTLIVHHPEDRLMKGEASLHNHFFRSGAACPSTIQELNLGQSPNKPYNIHGARLECFNYNDFHPKDEILRFLFSMNCTVTDRVLNLFSTATPELRNRVFSKVARDFQNGGYYFGSGEDAFYNRNGQSLTDEMRVKAILFAKMENH